jgi:hypothetical protein
LLLSDDDSTELRFNPSDAYIGNLADAITFRAWDQVSGTDGSYVAIPAYSDTSAFSSDTANATLNITPLVGSAISAGSETGDGFIPPVLTAIDGQGTSVVAWQNGTEGIVAQFYDASGTAIGSSFVVLSSDYASAVAVSANANGTFAFAWFGAEGVEVERYQDVDGSIEAIDSSPIVIASWTVSDGYFVDVGVAGNGAFDVAWSQPSEGGSELLQVQQYSNSGIATSDPNTVATSDSSYEFWNAQLSVASDGSFVIA